MTSDQAEYNIQVQANSGSKIVLVAMMAPQIFAAVFLGIEARAEAAGLRKIFYVSYFNKSIRVSAGGKLKR